MKVVAMQGGYTALGSNAIALGVNPPPPVQGPLDLYKQGLSVQELINQQALQKQAMQSNATAQQQQQLQLAQQQRADEDQKAIRALAPQFSSKDANGNGTFDFDGLASAAQARGVNPATINQMRMQNYQVQEAASKAGSEKLGNEQAHNKAAYEVIEGIKGVTDPVERNTAYQSGLNRLKLLGMDTSHLPPNVPNDDQLGAYETSLGMHGQILADAKTLAETNEKNAESSSKEWKEFPALGKLVNLKTGETKDVAGSMMTPAMMESKYVGVQQKKNQGFPLNPEETAFAKGYEKFKELVPAFQVAVANQTGAGAPAATVAKQFGMTPEAFDQQAEKYNSTGVMPQMGRGPSGIALQRAIMNRSGELHPGATLAANSAEFKSNQASLSKLQPQLDAVTAFENTANKNLDLFTTLAKKAIDTGIPLANLPIRMAAVGLGSEDQAALNAARQVAINEVAKVTSNPGLSGQLSDSARHEIEAFNPASATYGQTMRIAQVLKQDMANRHQSYVEQIGDIQKRLGGKLAPEQSNQHTAGGSSNGLKEGQTGKGSDGKKYIVKGGTWVPAP
jgi:hypothetical protein